MTVTPPENRPEKPKRRTSPLIAAGVVAVAVVAAAITVPLLANQNQSPKPAASTPAEAGASGAPAETTEPVTVRLGVNDIGKTFWQELVDIAAEDDITVELVSFTDYNTPNPALSAGDIDINKFQHVRYLAQYNAAQGEDLVAIGASEIYPIGFYSSKWGSVEEVPQGAEVTLSNNPANQVRPLLALYNAGLVEFTKPADWSITIDDVDYEQSVIGKLTPIDPTQTAASLDSVDIAFIDTPYRAPAGITEEQQIYVEDVDRDDLGQYINVFAVRGEDADDPALARIVEIYHSAEIEQAIRDEEGGFDGVFKTTSKDDLAAILEEQIAQF